MSATPPTDPWPLPELTRARRAIVVVDVVESVRLMQEDEAGFIDRWRRFVHEVRTVVLPKHGGRMVKSLGDGMLLEFGAVPQAVQSAFECRQWFAPSNETLPPERRIHLRVGMHMADVVVDDLDVYGSGVNLAARLASLAGPQEIVLSASGRDGLIDGLDGDVEDLGECWVKNLDAPVRAYRVEPVGVPRAATRIDPGATGQSPSVAVLPFRARTADPSTIAAGDLLAEEVVTSLSRSKFFSVISRLSAAAVCERGSGTAEIGKLLNAEYILAGTIDLAGPRFVAYAQLVQVTGDVVLWADRVAGNVSELLAGEAQAVSDLVVAVSQAIVQREIERATSSPLPTLASHRLLMAGIGHLHRSARQDFDQARLLLESLAERHSRSPQALAWLGKWHVLRAVQGLSMDAAGDAQKAVQYAQRALDTGAPSTLALTLSGHVLGFLKKDLPAAQQHLELSLSQNPNEPLTWIYLAALRAWQGRGNEAVLASQRALELSPLDPMRYYYDTLAAFAAMTAGQFQMAKELASRSLRAHRLHLSTHRTLAISQWHLDEHDNARRTVQDMMAIDPGFTVRKYLERFPGGDTEQARTNAKTLQLCGVPP
jgi:adenylate cyclase